MVWYVCTYGSIFKKRRLKFISVAPSWGSRNRTESEMQRLGWRNWYIISLMKFKKRSKPLTYFYRFTLHPTYHRNKVTIVGAVTAWAYLFVLTSGPYPQWRKYHTDPGIIPGTTVYVSSGSSPELLWSDLLHCVVGCFNRNSWLRGRFFLHSRDRASWQISCHTGL
jgi:hypothetical protein